MYRPFGFKCFVLMCSVSKKSSVLKFRTIHQLNWPNCGYFINHHYFNFKISAIHLLASKIECRAPIHYKVYSSIRTFDFEKLGQFFTFLQLEENRISTETRGTYYIYILFLKFKHWSHSQIILSFFYLFNIVKF